MKFLLAFGLGAAAFAQDIAGLEFLSGCWEARLGPVLIEEQWNRPAGGTLLGFSRTLKDARTVFTEFMRIERLGSEVVYTARIGTRSVTPFKLLRQSAAEVVFENSEHDFPQRIIYRKSVDGLSARIEGVDKGKARGEDFPYRRVTCP